MEKKKILLVDDEAEMLETYRSVLDDDRYELVTTLDPLEAVKLLSSTKFSLVISDLRMPVMTGIQLAAYVKSEKLNRDTKFFVISGALTDDSIEKLARLGVFEVIDKPFDSVKLVEKIENTIFPIVKEKLGYSAVVAEILKISCAETLTYYLGEGLVSEKAFLKSEPMKHAKSAAIIPIFGRWVFGSATLVMDEGFYKNIKSKLFPTDDPMSIPDFDDLVGELLNQMVGSLKKNLLQHEVLVNLGLPRLIPYYESHEYLVSGRTLCIPFNCNGSKCQVEFCLGNSLSFESKRETDAFTVFIS